MGFELSSKHPGLCTITATLCLVLAGLAPCLRAARATAQAAVPFWRVAHATGATLACLNGRAEDQLEVVACHDTCAPIPWQLDERGADGELALSDGPQANPDDSPGVLDAND